MNVKINPEYSKMLRPLTELKYSSIKEDIKLNGQWDPIKINQEGEILDGHHRFRICQELNIEPKTEVMSFSSKSAEKIFVKNSNRLRRQLNDFEEAEIAYSIEGDLRKTAGSNEPTGAKGRTAIIVSKETGLSPATYKRAKKIIQEGSEAAKLKLRSGRSTIFKEYKKIQKEQERTERSNEAAKIQIPEGCQLYQGDFNEVGRNIPDNSIPLILTDPPYGEEYLYLVELYGKFASRVLKPGGSLVLIMGQYDLPFKLNTMEKYGLKYVWQYCLHHNGPHAQAHTFGATIDVGWKPFIWFVKGEKTNATRVIKDFIDSEPPTKLMHDWEQSTKEAKHIIEGLTVENEIVLDCFMGSGTFGLAALRLNRKFIGIEIDPVHFSNAQRRLSPIKEVVK